MTGKIFCAESSRIISDVVSFGNTPLLPVSACGIRSKLLRIKTGASNGYGEVFPGSPLCSVHGQRDSCATDTDCKHTDTGCDQVSITRRI